MMNKYVRIFVFLEKLLIIGPEIRQPYDWLNCNVTHLKQKYLTLKYFCTDYTRNHNKNKMNNNVSFFVGASMEMDHDGDTDNDKKGGYQ